MPSSPTSSSSATPATAEQTSKFDKELRRNESEDSFEFVNTVVDSAIDVNSSACSPLADKMPEVKEKTQESDKPLAKRNQGFGSIAQGKRDDTMKSIMENYRLMPCSSEQWVAERKRLLENLEAYEADIKMGRILDSIQPLYRWSRPPFDEYCPKYGPVVWDLANLGENSFSKVMLDSSYVRMDPRNGSQSTDLHSNISKKAQNVILKNEDRLNSAIAYDRDFSIPVSGYKTLLSLSLFAVNDQQANGLEPRRRLVVERPQHLLMRVAVGIHGEDIDSVLETYKLMSEKWFIHASTTLRNAGTFQPQLSSCFLITAQDDSIKGIYNTYLQCVNISAYGGGIGINLHDIPATIANTSDTNSYGLARVLRTLNATAKYMFRGPSERSGVFTIYLEPWHANFFDFLYMGNKMNKNMNMNFLERQKSFQDLAAHYLFLAVWIPDLFMKRVQDDGDWYLMCPHKCLKLSNLWGAKFDQLYMSYEAAGKYLVKIKAREVWRAILKNQIETGHPFMLYKDTCNVKSNQKNVGTILGGSFCTGIVEYSSSDEIGACSLASIAVKKFVDVREAKFDFHKLRYVTKVVTKNLNKSVDVTSSSLSQAARSNTRHRPIGIGVQGLADAFMLMRLPFDSPEAAQLNRDIFETIYYAALSASCELAEEFGPYETYNGSPMSQGILQFDMWNVEPNEELCDWKSLRERIARFGVRNSLLLAQTPTASTAIILGNNESVEPYSSNVYTRRVSSVKYQVVNPHLMKDLVDLGIWNEDIKKIIVACDGSVQGIDQIPADMKALYKTAWEIDQKCLIDMAATRGAFIDQSQSTNIYINEPDYSVLTSLHFYGWEKGLKTGMHHLKMKPARENDSPIEMLYPARLNR